MNESTASMYTRTYTSYSGCDIVATFNNTVIGTLQAITYSISREKAPNYVMGRAEPVSITRGKRGIAGTLVFTMFDRDALLEAFKGQKIRKYKANAVKEPMTVSEWDKLMTGYAANNTGDGLNRNEELVNDLTEEAEVFYADELPPFDITISFANEYGQESTLIIYGVELINEGSGFSIDAVTAERACTFIARRIEPMKAINAPEL